MVNQIMNELHCQDKSKAVLIGDSLSDLEMAKNAQIKFIGVGTGLDSKAFENGSENFVKTLRDLKILSYD